MDEIYRGKIVTGEFLEKAFGESKDTTRVTIDVPCFPLSAREVIIMSPESYEKLKRGGK